MTSYGDLDEASPSLGGCVPRNCRHFLSSSWDGGSAMTSYGDLDEASPSLGAAFRETVATF